MVRETTDIKTEIDYKDIKDAGFNEYLTSEDYTKASIDSGITQDKLKADYLTGGTIGKEGPIDIGSDRFRLDGKETRQLIKDGANNRVLIGKRPDGTFGIDVSQTGYDVTSASSNQKVMSSDFNMFKIVKILTGTFTQTDTEGGWDGRQAFEVVHGEGYAPMIFGGVSFTDTTTHYYPFGCAGMQVYDDETGYKANYPDGSNPENLCYCVAWTTTNSVFIKAMYHTSPIVFSYKIYIVRETLG